MLLASVDVLLASVVVLLAGASVVASLVPPVGSVPADVLVPAAVVMSVVASPSLAMSFSIVQPARPTASSPPIRREEETKG